MAKLTNSRPFVKGHEWWESCSEAPVHFVGHWQLASQGQAAFIVHNTGRGGLLQNKSDTTMHVSADIQPFLLNWRVSVFVCYNGKGTCPVCPVMRPRCITMARNPIMQHLRLALQFGTPSTGPLRTKYAYRMEQAPSSKYRFVNNSTLIIILVCKHDSRPLTKQCLFH